MTDPGKNRQDMSCSILQEGKTGAVTIVETVLPKRVWRAGLGHTPMPTGMWNGGVLQTFLSVQFTHAGQSPSRELSSSTIHPNPDSPSESL